MTLTLDQLKTEVSATPPTNTLSFVASDLQSALNAPYKPPVTIAYTVLADPGAGNRLNFRAAPAGHILTAVAQGAPLGVLDNGATISADKHLWLHVTLIGANPALLGYVAQELTVRQIAPPTPVTHKLGLHSLLDGRSKVQDFVAHGAKLASITIVADAGYANLMAQTVPYVIFRDSPDLPVSIPDDEAGAEAAGDAYANALFAKLDATGDLDLQSSIYIQGPNEVKWTPGHSGFWLGYMRNLTARGRKAAICAYGVGQPETDQWQTLTPALQYAKANGHIAVLHCYCAPGTPVGQLSADGADYELRPIRLYESVPPDARPVLIIAEFAHEFTRGLFEGTDALITTTTLYQAVIAPYEYVASVNLFTGGGESGEWERSSIDSALTDRRLIALYV